MALSKRFHLLTACAAVCALASGQPGQRRDNAVKAKSGQRSNLVDAGASSTSFSSSSTTSTARSEFTTAVVPVYLVDVAQSLLHEYFPSSTPLNLAEVSWPSTVVIGTATYGLNAKAKETVTVTAHPTHSTHSIHSTHSTPTTAQRQQQTTSPTDRPKKENDNNSNQKHDEDLAIILACILGFVAIATAAVIFFCLRRRRDTNGSFFLRRSSPSTSSKGSRFANVFGGNTAYHGNDIEARESNGTAPLTAAAAGAGIGASIGAIGADRDNHTNTVYPRRNSNSDSDENQYYTPRERHDSTLSYTGIGAQQTRQHPEMSQWEPASAGAAGAGVVSASHANKSTRPTILRKPVASQQNPFSSPLDHEADDVVSPILPSRSFERHHGSANMVHYPSMSEVDEFDFAGNGNRRRTANSGFTGGWRLSRERTNGRHELM